MFDWHDFLKVLHIAAIVLSAIVSLVCMIVSVMLARRARASNVIGDLRKALEAGDGDLRKALEAGDGDLRESLDSHKSTVNGSLVDHERRLSIVESTLRHMPSHSDLLEIRGALGNLNAAVAAIGERSKTTHEMLQTIQEHLMESSK